MWRAAWVCDDGRAIYHDRSGPTASKVVIKLGVSEGNTGSPLSVRARVRTFAEKLEEVRERPTVTQPLRMLWSSPNSSRRRLGAGVAEQVHRRIYGTSGPAEARHSCD